MLNPFQKAAESALRVFYRWTNSWPWPLKVLVLLLIIAASFAWAPAVLLWVVLA